MCTTACAFFPSVPSPSTRPSSQPQPATASQPSSHPAKANTLPPVSRVRPIESIIDPSSTRPIPISRSRSTSMAQKESAIRNPHTHTLLHSKAVASPHITPISPSHPPRPTLPAQPSPAPSLARAPSSPSKPPWVFVTPIHFACTQGCDPGHSHHHTHTDCSEPWR